MLDMSKEQAGIDEIGLLLDEIRLYIDQQFLEQPRQDARIESLEHHIELLEGLMWYTVKATTSTGEKHVLLRKAILIIINKIDMYGEDAQAELWKEYMSLLHTTLKDVFAQRKTIYDPSIIEKSTLPISALSRTGIDHLLDTTVRILNAPLICTYSNFQPIQVDQVSDPFVREVEKTEVDKLVTQ